MKFFIPAARDAAMAEQAWQATRSFLADQGFPASERRIRRLAFWNRGDHFDLEVGGHHPGMEDEWPVDGREEDDAIRCIVFVILEAAGGGGYYVCLPYRGVFRNYPWLVHADEATDIEDFEPEPAET
ncbi:MAG: hypothetical protein QOH47_3103 [Sphingomonadales bacterium]|jgi:hypothetical protein|nr:hypothetical protein [Sphingomonadales bacterium]